MLSISPSIAGSVACAFLFAVAPVATNGQGIMGMIPQTIKDGIPEECQGNTDAEFEIAIDCAYIKITEGECLGLLGVISEFGNIPSASEIETCDDINDPFCTFANACEACSTDFEALVTCVVLKTPGIDQKTTDFIDSCSLGCGVDIDVDVDVDVDVVEDVLDGNITSSNDGIIDNLLAPMP